MTILFGLRFAFLLLIFPAVFAAASTFAAAPLRYQNCDVEAFLPQPAQRVLAIDINSVEIMLALGAPLFASAGVEDAALLLEAYRAPFEQAPSLSRGYPTLAAVSGSGADLVLGGWNAGFFMGSPLTPSALAQRGIASYLMRETCPPSQGGEALSLESGPFQDIASIARLTGQQAAGEKLLRSLRQRLARIEADVARYGRSEPVRVFVYDSGGSEPYTAGSGSILRDVVRRAGGELLQFGLEGNWGPVSWEAVVAAAPELIFIVDYGFGDGQRKRKMLEGLPQLKNLPAAQQRKFYIAPYAAALSGVRSVGLAENLADQLICDFSNRIDEGAFTCYEQPYASSP